LFAQATCVPELSREDGNLERIAIGEARDVPEQREFLLARGG
jgi:hypothetical protein